MKAFLLLTILTLNLFASEIVEVKVKGMVCSFCSNGIEKKFLSQSEVKKVNVNMDSKLVTIEFKEGQSLSKEKVSKLITASGFNIADYKKRK